VTCSNVLFFLFKLATLARKHSFPKKSQNQTTTTTPTKKPEKNLKQMSTKNMSNMALRKCRSKVLIIKKFEEKKM
jgi:surface antigen